MLPSSLSTGGQEKIDSDSAHLCSLSIHFVNAHFMLATNFILEALTNCNVVSQYLINQ